MFPATVILMGGQMKDSGGRPGPAVIRAICPPGHKRDGAHELINDDPSIPLTADTGVLGASPLWGGGQGCHEAWPVTPIPPSWTLSVPPPHSWETTPPGPCEAGYSLLLGRCGRGAAFGVRLAWAPPLQRPHPH